MLTRPYRVACDGCGRQAPAGDTEPQALAAADFDGYSLAGDVALCRRCQASGRWPDARITLGAPTPRPAARSTP